MKILVTGAKGFVGKNLCAQLKNIKDGKAKYYGDLKISEVFEYDLDSTPEQLESWCKNADFVFNLAGVNRPQDPKEFMEGNFGFASVLLDTLKKLNERERMRKRNERERFEILDWTSRRLERVRRREASTICWHM